MENLEKYRQWLGARGVEKPSEAEIKRFRQTTQGRPYGSLFDFLLVAWIDGGGKYGGTKGWLAAQGLLEPSDEDLKGFSRKIRQTAIWRGSILLLVVIAWFVFVWVTGLSLVWLDAVIPVALVVCGLGASAGKRLPGRDDAARARAHLSRLSERRDAVDDDQ